MKSQQKRHKTRFLAQGLMFLVLLFSGGYSFAQSKTIIDEWASVQPPKAPELKAITLEPKTTAFLVLDIIRQGCNKE